MQGGISRVLGALVLIAAAAVPAGAHHSAANYDQSKEVTLRGTVVEWIWQNPHCFLKFDANDSSGATRRWTVEVQNPTTMTQHGWSRRMFAAGDMVTVSLHPERDGAPTGLITKVVLPNGKTFDADPAGAAAAAAHPLTN